MDDELKDLDSMGMHLSDEEMGDLGEDDEDKATVAGDDDDEDDADSMM